MFTFALEPTGYELIGDRPTPATTLFPPLPLYIRFTLPMPVDSVHAE